MTRTIVPVLTSRVRVAMLLGLAGVASSGLASAQNAAPAQNRAGATAEAWRAKNANTLPVTRLTLYRSGVGSFERRGQITGDMSVQLKFNVDQINDILKSMVVLDMGGRVESVGYGSKDPLSRRLSSFGVDISDNPSMAALLARLRGTNVTVTTTEGPVTGSVLGTETRPEAQGAATAPIQVTYLNLISGGIRSVKLSDVKSFVVNDEQLAAELDKALAAMADQRADRIKTVDISTRGAGARELVVAYVHETPVWKTSYRLVIPDEKAGKNSQTNIQGWAIVENTTDEDWENVSLALVAGQPVSFKMDLYEPLYSPRPTVAVPMAAGVMPKVYDLALRADLERAEMKVANRATPGAGGVVGGYKDAARAAEMPAPASAMAERRGGVSAGKAMSGDDLLAFGMPAAAHGEEGELFRYELDAPVTIQRQRSAMLPILGAPIESRRVSIYNPGDGQPHPMRGLELTNNTAMQLMPGPVSVFEGGTYAGDAQIGHIPAGDKRLLAFATDLEVGVTTKSSTDSVVRKTRIVKGVLERTIKYVNTSEYTFVNKDMARGRTLLVEQPRMGGYELVGISPTETTETLYRFEVGLEAGKAGTLKIPQEATGSTTLAVTDIDTRTLFEYCTDGKASEAVINAVRELAKRRDALEVARQKVSALETSTAEIDKDQSRLRQNMIQLDRASQLYAQYMQKLTAQEKKIDELGVQLEQARDGVRSSEKELADFVATLSVE
jgi:exonuclease VII small subunit